MFGEAWKTSKGRKAPLNDAQQHSVPSVVLSARNGRAIGAMAIFFLSSPDCTEGPMPTKTIRDGTEGPMPME